MSASVTLEHFTEVWRNAAAPEMRQLRQFVHQDAHHSGAKLTAAEAEDFYARLTAESIDLADLCRKCEEQTRVRHLEASEYQARKKAKRRTRKRRR